MRQACQKDGRQFGWQSPMQQLPRLLRDQPVFRVVGRGPRILEADANHIQYARRAAVLEAIVYWVKFSILGWRAGADPAAAVGTQAGDTAPAPLVRVSQANEIEDRHGKAYRCEIV